jgi:hypothetical protein
VRIRLKKTRMDGVETRIFGVESGITWDRELRRECENARRLSGFESSNVLL